MSRAGPSTLSSTLHVTTAPTAGDGSIGIVPGQALQNGGIPHGFYIQGDATHFPTLCSPNCTGTGGIGTYALSQSIANPPLAQEAIPGGTLGSVGTPVAFNTEVQSGPPMTPPGTTITGCSTLSGTQCPPGGGATLTLSNSPSVSWDYASWALPGPNNAKGSQMFNITTSTTGGTYGPITAGISGSNMTVTAGAGNLNYGQVVMGVGGGAVTGITTTAAMTLGQIANIPVSSCAGVTAYMYVVGFHSGNPIFPPGTHVLDCTGTMLTIDIVTGDGFTPGQGCSGTFGYSVAGSNVLRMPAVRSPIGCFYLGMPANTTSGFGAGWIPAGTTVTNYGFNKGDTSLIDVTLSNPVSTSTEDALTVNFGGAINAAPSGTALTFLNGASTIIEGGAGTGGNGTYTLDQAATLAPGSTVYAYDTPGTIYITGGPRMLISQELLWSDAVPWGAISAMIYGTSPSRQTVKLSPTYSYGQISAIAAHTAGSGKMWALPTGMYSQTQTDFEGDWVWGFAPGVNMACATTNYRPSVGCGQSYAARNQMFTNLIGRLVVGNNSGGSAAEYEEYDHNSIADIVDLSTVAITYMGEMLQGEDESSNTNGVRQDCNANMPMYSAYASGFGWSGTCSTMMVMQNTTAQLGGYWYGAIFGAPWSVFYSTSTTQPPVDCPAGLPTTSFKVQGGVVTHC